MQAIRAQTSALITTAKAIVMLAAYAAERDVSKSKQSSIVRYELAQKNFRIRKGTRLGVGRSFNSDSRERVVMQLEPAIIPIGTLQWLGIEHSRILISREIETSCYHSINISNFVILN